MQHYSQLTSGQRYQISVLLKKGDTQTEIAQSIGVHKSTISHESIYQYIYWDKVCGGDLYTHLRFKKKRRK